MRFFPFFLLALSAFFLVSCGSTRTRSATGTGVKYKKLDSSLAREVQALGNRNWIVIADQAFPLHSRRGVRTLLVQEKIPEVLNGVIDVINSQPHVKPVFHRTRELAYIQNDSAPGIEPYRNSISQILQPFLAAGEVRDFDYRELSVVLEDPSKTFAVLVLKTTTALPYSAIFIELENS